LVPGTSQDVYHRVSNEVRDLMDKTIHFVEKIEEREFDIHLNLVSKVAHEKGTGQIYVDMHPDIRDMLLDLKKYFTRVPVVELIGCASIYVQQHYELLDQYEDTGDRLNVDQELRQILNLKKKYKNFYDFRKLVLKQTQKDDVAHTNISFTWKEIK